MDDTKTISLISTTQQRKLPGKGTVIYVLICLIFMNYGNYYINDIPQELGDYFTDYFDKTPEDVEFLYSLYSIVALPMTLLGGLIVTK
jgi:hypothetical protein